MAGRREMFIRDRQRNSTARRTNLRAEMKRQQAQARLLDRLIREARAESK